MKRLLFSVCVGIFALLNLSVNAKGKHPPAWNPGRVILHSGDTLHCMLRFTRRVSEGLLQIKEASTIRMLTVKTVKAFYYLDEYQNVTRAFYNVLFIPESSDRRHEVFTEVMYEDKDFCIVQHKTLGYGKSFQINPFRKKKIVRSFYFLEKGTGLILPMSKESAIALTRSRQREIDAYLADHPRLRELPDYITLLNYHQSLK